jgi:hypothetical protein
MTVRGLCVAETREMRALTKRKWATSIDAVECVPEDGDGEPRLMPVWEVTPEGREALKAAEAAGITIR